MSDAVIKVDQLSKSFVRQARPRRWLDVFSGGWRSARREPQWALRNVSFNVRAGDMLGIVGGNGAGKSTLLRLLGGIGQPTGGSIAIHGKIGGLLELGGGFQPDLTGRENALMAAVVAGLLKEEALERLPEIVRFAELEHCLDDPVRTYSTGMAMRLAFAVAVHSQPDVLLVDEYLSVGDLGFQAKCMNRIVSIRESGCAIVLVSHGMEQVRRLCDRALWLRSGEVAAFDEAAAVTEAYEQAMRDESLRLTPEGGFGRSVAGLDLRLRENRFGSMEMEITKVQLLPREAIKTGDPLVVKINYQSPQRLASPIFAVSISQPDGTVCLDQNTQSSLVAVPDLMGHGAVQLAFDRLDLGAGEYFVDVGVFEAAWGHAYDYHWHVYPLVVEGKPCSKGVLAPPLHWSMLPGGDQPGSKPEGPSRKVGASGITRLEALDPVH